VQLFLQRLAADTAGNTIMLIAAALLPIMAMIGGGIDMGRNYLAESRLQQACDAGVLAARKALGSATTVDAATEVKMANAGARFFNTNFRTGAYGSENRQFAMVLNQDLSIDGTANVDMPTTIMQMFGFDETAIAVNCTAELNIANTDVMMALDVTGSMNETLEGDSIPKIAALKAVVKSFHAQLEANKVAGMRTRYGFVPYSTNVNVGGLLEDDWVAREWTYQSREWMEATSSSGVYGYHTAADRVSGSYSASTFHPRWAGSRPAPPRPGNLPR
jgi:Flp pilus assembly protein TadG